MSMIQREMEAEAVGGPSNRPGGLTGSGPGLEQSMNYTIPGILHFIKHEWSRFERERANWEVERAELQAKIAFLQGERRGHENLMRDLVRRIKMLEYALKQERAKLYKMQHGKELVFNDMKPPVEPENNHAAVDLSSVSNQKEESRRVLRDYLREVGFPDNILEARVSRINIYRNLHSSSQAEQSSSRGESPKPLPPPSSNPPSISSPHPHPLLVNGPISAPNGTDTQAQPSSTKNRDTSPPGMKDTPNSSLEGDARETGAEAMMAEERVMKEFEFLNEEDDSDDEEEGDEEEGEWEDQTEELLQGLERSGALSEASSGVDLDTESAMDEFTHAADDFSSPSHRESSGIESGPEGMGKGDEWHEVQKQAETEMGADAVGKEDEWKAEFSREVQKYTQNKPKKKRVSARPTRSELQRMEQFKNQAEGDHSRPNPPFPGLGGMDMIRLPGQGRRTANPDALGMLPNQAALSEEGIGASILGDLAGLSVSNEATAGFEMAATESVKKWENKYTMRSHFDAVTSAAFHPTDHVLVTGSEDCTLKLWNIQKASQARKQAIVDVEPVHTLRGHRGGVLCVAMGCGGEVCFSGSTDTTIRVWQLPGDLSDPFDAYDPEIHRGVLQGHTDAIWDLAVHPSSGVLLSCAADGSCRLWNHQLTSPQVKLFATDHEAGYGNPTSVDFLATDGHQMVACYTSAKTVIYDLETAQPVLHLDSSSTYDGTSNTQINKVVAHPTLPIIVTAHEDKYIRFYDANTGQVIHSMTAHMDAVTGLAIDPHGLYLLSGSHDGSLRFWNMDSRICIQETTAHRFKRYEESIFNVACHLTKPYFASCGADGIAKVFV